MFIARNALGQVALLLSQPLCNGIAAGSQECPGSAGGIQWVTQGVRVASELPWGPGQQHRASQMTAFLSSAARKLILKGLRCTNTLSANNYNIAVTLCDRLAGHSCLETLELL